jgi:putative transposase
VKGKWVYLYRAVDSQGDTLDFILSERRDEEAATAFFKQAINNNGLNNVLGKMSPFKTDHNLIL